MDGWPIQTLLNEIRHCATPGCKGNVVPVGVKCQGLGGAVSVSCCDELLVNWPMAGCYFVHCLVLHVHCNTITSSAHSLHT